MFWISAIGLALGGTYVMCMPLRTVQYPSIFWSTFALSYVAAVAMMYYVELSVVPQMILGGGGLLVALALHLVRKKTKKIEKDYEETRSARGEQNIS